MEVSSFFFFKWINLLRFRQVFGSWKVLCYNLYNLSPSDIMSVWSATYRLDNIFDREKKLHYSVCLVTFIFILTADLCLDILTLYSQNSERTVGKSLVGIRCLGYLTSETTNWQLEGKKGSKRDYKGPAVATNVARQRTDFFGVQIAGRPVVNLKKT